MSKISNENLHENFKEPHDSGLKVLNDNINHAIKGSPYRKKIIKKQQQLDQIEVAQKLLNDFGNFCISSNKPKKCNF
jgi:hypothetical protein